MGTMKSVIVVCLAALAAAEPEANAYYGSYGYGLGYSNLGYGYAPMRYSGAYGYAAPATSAGIAVRGYGTPATVGTNVPYGYAASGNYVADSFGAVHIAKREADAEPEADALYGYGYNNIGYSNLGYNNIGYSNLGVSTYTRPVATVSRIATPVVSRPVVSTVSRIAAPVVSSCFLQLSLLSPESPLQLSPDMLLQLFPDLSFLATPALEDLEVFGKRHSLRTVTKTSKQKLNSNSIKFEICYVV